MENIVAMILEMINLKMKQIDVAKYLNDSGALPYGVPVTGLGQEVSNMTNETATNATAANVTNATGMLIAPSILFNISEYQPSNTCQIQGAENASAGNMTANDTLNDTLCCNNQQIGVNGTQFCRSLTLIGKEWVNEIDNLCGNAS